jgi:hypothetical protein
LLEGERVFLLGEGEVGSVGRLPTAGAALTAGFGLTIPSLSTAFYLGPSLGWLAQVDFESYGTQGPALGAELGVVLGRGNMRGRLSFFGRVLVPLTGPNKDKSVDPGALFTAGVRLML